MLTIFIADDHQILRDGLKRIINEQPDYRVVGETGDGLEIASMVRKFKPDIVILDISMPNLRGIEAINKIRKINRNIKILILTMHKNEEFVYECLCNGALAYILKEDADQELLKALKKITNNELCISSSFSSDVLKKLLEHKSTVKRKNVLAYRKLTPREREVFKLIAEAHSNKKIAKKLGISVRTVEHHRLNIMHKLKIKNATQLIKYAIESGFIDITLKTL